MQSDKQSRASKTNGALSRGPVTEQGKHNSAGNNFRHGLLAQTVVLEEESTERFLELYAGFMDEYQPSTASQVSLVETMAVARWRQLRVWGAQKTAMDRDMALQDPSVGPPAVRALLALRGSPESSCPPDVLLRYEIAFDRQFSRAIPPRQANRPLSPRDPSRPNLEGKNIPLRFEPSKGLKTND
jgi:hypothetical protein